MVARSSRVLPTKELIVDVFMMEISANHSNPVVERSCDCFGPMVEWFTMPACHAVWCEFESRWDRK